VRDPEQNSFATTHESRATNVSIMNGPLFAGYCELVRLNFVTCRSLLNVSRQHWESVFSAQSPEQLVRTQADMLPSLAAQIAGYIGGWMDIASEAAARLGRDAPDCMAWNTPPAATIFAGMATGVRGADAMMRAVNPFAGNTDSAAAATSIAASKGALPAEMSAAPPVTSTATGGRSPGRRRRT
jgi:hypothetical protein